MSRPDEIRSLAEAYLLEVRCGRPLDFDPSIAAEEVLRAYMTAYELGERSGIKDERSAAVAWFRGLEGTSGLIHKEFAAASLVRAAHREAR